MACRLGLVALLGMLSSACGDTPQAREPSAPTYNVTVSAYCLKGKTASGLPARAGSAAADPDVFPLGSVIRLTPTRGATGHEGVYTILDTGRSVQGRRIDIYIPSCPEAVRFGRRSMTAEVLRLGSNR